MMILPDPHISAHTYIYISFRFFYVLQGNFESAFTLFYALVCILHMLYYLSSTNNILSENDFSNYLAAAELLFMPCLFVAYTIKCYRTAQLNCRFIFFCILFGSIDCHLLFAMSRIIIFIIKQEPLQSNENFSGS